MCTPIARCCAGGAKPRYGLAMWTRLLLGVGLAVCAPARGASLPPPADIQGIAVPGRYVAWAGRQPVVAHPEIYRFRSELYRDLAQVVAERPGVIAPFEVGRTAEGRPIWAFRIRDPVGQIHTRVLVFAGIHALEWISSETATGFALDLAADPPDGVEVVVIPLLNPDGRNRVESDLLAGLNRFQRTNGNKVDLNRDFAHNREPRAIWRHIIPGYYESSPAPLSQPESRAIDRLASTRFDVAVSLHAFGGFFYYPWAGLWQRPPDHREFVRLGRVMAKAQGSHAYKVRQLSRWGFFFRAHGAEIDHIYGEYGTLSFLIELTRSGLNPLRPRTLSTHFRWFNPVRPERHIEKGVSALRALVGTLAWEGWAPEPVTSAPRP